MSFICSSICRVRETSEASNKIKPYSIFVIINEYKLRFKHVIKRQRTDVWLLLKYIIIFIEFVGGLDVKYAKPCLVDR